MMVDAHVHLWRLARGDNTALDPSMAAIFRDREPADLAPLLDSAGVDRYVVVQAAETLAETFFLAGLAAAEPRIAGVVAWLDPGSPAVEEEVAGLASIRAVKGVRPVRDDNRSIAWMLDARLGRGWAALEASALSLDILVQNWCEIPLAAQLARERPGLRVVLDHCGKPDIAGGLFGPWAEMIAAIASLPNVACKLSGLMNCAGRAADAATVGPFADHVIDSFGAARVLWASDWPPLDLASDYMAWRELSMAILGRRSEQDRRRILGGTAAEVYRL